MVDRYSACLGVDPQTKYRSDFQKNEKKLQIMWNATDKKKKYSRYSNLTFRSDKENPPFKKINSLHRVF